MTTRGRFQPVHKSPHILHGLKTINMESSGWAEKDFGPPDSAGPFNTEPSGPSMQSNGLELTNHQQNRLRAPKP